MHTHTHAHTLTLAHTHTHILTHNARTTHIHTHTHTHTLEALELLRDRPLQHDDNAHTARDKQQKRTLKRTAQKRHCVVPREAPLGRKVWKGLLNAL